MSTPAEALAAGLPPQDREFLDLAHAEVIRRRISPAERAMSAAQAEAFQKGLDPGIQLPPAIPAAAAPANTSNAVQAIPIPVPGAALPATAPVAAAAPPAPAPTSDAYPRRANDRINKLYGQKMAAEEYAASTAAQLAEANRRLEMLLTREAGRTAAPAPYTNQYGSHPGLGAPSDGPPPAGDFISRSEVQAMLERERSLAGQAFDLIQAHNAARAEAVTDFPDVFADPQLRADADRILASDKHLRASPNAPYLAAALARGLSVADARDAAAQAAVADVRKTALSGIGPSVAEGNGPPADRATRYQAALVRATRTQLPEDWTLVRMIQLGQA